MTIENIYSHLIHTYIYIYLRDPLPAKHLEEQSGPRKGGGTGWQDIKATDLLVYLSS